MPLPGIACVISFQQDKPSWRGWQTGNSKSHIRAFLVPAREPYPGKGAYLHGWLFLLRLPVRQITAGIEENRQKIHRFPGYSSWPIPHGSKDREGFFDLSPVGNPACDRIRVFFSN